MKKKISELKFENIKFIYEGKLFLKINLIYNYSFILVNK